MTQPTRYRNRTAEAEAMQWTGSNADALSTFCGLADFQVIDPEDRAEDPDETAAVRTHEHGGWLGLKPSDWVLKHGEGRFSAASDEGFRETWEAVPVVVPPADRADLRDRIAEALYAHNHPGWATRYTDLDQDEQDTYLARADAVLVVLPAPDNRAALREAARLVAEYTGNPIDANAQMLRRIADGTPRPTDPQPAAPPTPDVRATEFDEMENARKSFPVGVKPALCKTLAAADQRNIGRLPIPDRKRYTEQADAVLRLMGWRENQLTGQFQDTLKALRASEQTVAELRRLAGEAQQDEAPGATPGATVSPADGPMQCPLCPYPVTLHTPNGTRAHFTTVHPEQRLTGRGAGPWPLLLTDEADPIARVREVLETEAVVGRSALEYRGLITAALLDRSAEARQDPAPGGEERETEEQRADREETERDHVAGDHQYCDQTCEVEFPTEHLRNFVIAKGYPGTKGALDELLRRAAAGPTREMQQDPASGTPRCGDQFEQWLTTQRDEHRDDDRGQWTTLDNLLNLYRLHADTGTPLGEHVCEDRAAGHCGCLEPPTHLGGKANAENCPGCNAERRELPYPFLCPADTGTVARSGQPETSGEFDAL